MASNEGEDSHTKGKTIKERLKMMLNNDVMSDVTFVIKDAMEDVVVFKAHKFVLAVSSPVFYAMFYGRLSERKDKIELPDCDSESFLEFLRFLYCDEVNLTGSSVLQVLYLAKKYIVPQLEIARPIQWNSSAIEPNRTPIVRLLNSIEHNRIHNKILPIERNRTFDYRTIGIIERSINGRRIA